MWRTNKVDNETLLIQDGNVVVGSIVLKDKSWCVEIMAFGENVRFSSTEQLQGIEQVFDRLIQTTVAP